ncbi:G protein-coupled receptor family protein [Nocardiopsis ganjiahuensis]|uniref:hypothetical protein n=1 Tax=Nocardiopsis ganjiahuensis TaxID=239984 RepID=UPI000346141E|nr:hypothetical protein [Nocardiopsis ganjiahuensis]
MNPMNQFDQAILVSLETPSLNRARASRARRRLHVVLLTALILTVAVLLAVTTLRNTGGPQFVMLAAVVSLVAALLYLVTRLNKITRASLPVRLLDERQREERDHANRFGQSFTSAVLGTSFILVILITTFSPASVVFPSWLASPLLWVLAMVHASAPAFYLAWIQPDELPDDEPAQP